MPLREFTSAEELIEHYRKVLPRTRKAGEDYVRAMEEQAVRAAAAAETATKAEAVATAAAAKACEAAATAKAAALAARGSADEIGHRLTMKQIIDEVCQHYRVSRIDLLSRRRTRDVMRPRQISMFLARTLTPLSLPQISHQLGMRDHTAVLHGFRKIERLLAIDADLAEAVDLLTRRLLGR